MPDMLPGFEPPATGPGPIAASAGRTIAALHHAGLLEDSHALTVTLVEQLAAAVDRGLSAGKVSIATTTMVRELREALASLPAPDEAAGGDAWEKFEKYLADAEQQ